MKNKDFNWTDLLLKLPKWMNGLIFLSTSIIGFILLVRSNFQVGIFVLVSVIFSFFLGLCIYVIIAKTPPLIEGGAGVPRFPEFRSMAIVGALTIMVLGVAAFILKPSRQFAITAINGTPLPPNYRKDGVEIINITEGQSTDYIRTQVVLSNNLEQEVFVSHVKLFWDFGRVDCLCPYEPCYYEYVISDNVYITSLSGTSKKSNVTFTVPVSPKDKSFDGFSFEASGTSALGCGENNSQLEFDTSIILQPMKFTAFYVDIPINLFQKQGGKYPFFYINPVTNLSNTFINPTLPTVEVVTNIGIVP